jgi:hypothetical protein
MPLWAQRCPVREDWNGLWLYVLIAFCYELLPCLVVNRVGESLRVIPVDTSAYSTNMLAMELCENTRVLPPRAHLVQFA